MVLIVGIILLRLGDLAITLISSNRVFSLARSWRHGRPARAGLRIVRYVVPPARFDSLDNTAVARNNRYGDDWLTLD